ncbi:hypothetical protein AB6T85_07290 [Erwinia sp. ACCC 02193]|uniref:PPM-type phosphatase domain-containing protein n=1 Tax=Erwinia aeris TaxID=3239803 RepID=A0ABV4E5Q9_9GAMM
MNEGLILTFQGAERADNQDFASWHIGQRNEIWIIADGATKAKDSGHFVTSFCEKILLSLSSVAKKITAPLVFNLIETVHADIRKDFICAKGSFLLFIVDRETKTQHCFFLGDCRIGTIQNTGIKWATFPHNMVVAQQITNEERIRTSLERHLLFRQLIARRFERPDYIQLDLDLSLPIIMATDGFWSDCSLIISEKLTGTTLCEVFKSKQNRPDDATMLLRPGQF